MTESDSREPAVPRVTVLMPVFNTARYLSAAIESILAQTFEDFEFVIVDDGSTDGSGEIAARHAREDSRIRLVRQQNRGVSAASNAGVAVARGELVARFDADDLSLPDRLAVQVDYMDRHPDVLAVGSSFEVMDAKGRPLTVLYPPCSPEEIEELLLTGHCPISNPSAMMRRSALERIGGYDTSFVTAGDYDLWLRMSEHGPLANVRDCLIRYRLIQTSLSEAKGRNQREGARRACEAAWKRRGITDGVFMGAEHWRPGTDRDSRHRFACRYGWWAFNYGERRTAAIYGLKAIAIRPLSSAGWRLLASAAVKRLPARVTL